jgi:hypothetical protein
MYNSSSLASSIYGRRNTSYLEVLGLSTDDHVFVWSNTQSKKNTMSIVRMFALDKSIPYWAERDGSKYYIGNGTDPTDWENTSILSQTLCRRDGETPEPVESCDSSLGEYERESDCKSMGWPCAKEGNCWKRTKAQITYARSNTCNPVLIVQGSATTVTITPNTNTTNQQQFVDAGNNELSFGLSTGIPSSFKIGGPDGTTTLTVPVTGSSGTITIGTYNFKAGKSYQITPNCTSGGNSGGDSGGGSGGNDTYSVSIYCMPKGIDGTMGGDCIITPSANAKAEDLRKITAWACICKAGEATNCTYTAVQVSSNSGIIYGSGYLMSMLGCGIVKDPDGSKRDILNNSHCQSSVTAGGCSYKWEWHNYEFGY